MEGEELRPHVLRFEVSLLIMRQDLLTQLAKRSEDKEGVLDVDLASSSVTVDS